jgi:hypothetical protein
VRLASEEATGTLEKHPTEGKQKMGHASADGLTPKKTCPAISTYPTGHSLCTGGWERKRDDRCLWPANSFFTSYEEVQLIVFLLFPKDFLRPVAHPPIRPLYHENGIEARRAVYYSAWMSSLDIFKLLMLCSG